MVAAVEEELSLIAVLAAWEVPRQRVAVNAAEALL
jgi:hypothetical protein